MREKAVEPDQSLSEWRRMARAAWRAPNDPQFYGELDLDAGALLAAQAQLRNASGVHVTVTHLVTRAVAHALEAVPELGSRARRGATDVFVIVTTDAGLSGVKLTDVGHRSVVDVARALGDGTRDARAGRGELAEATRTLARLPGPLRRAALRVGAWLASDLGLDLPPLGVHAHPFGDAMITSVGMWSVSRAFSPLAAYYRVPVLVRVGEVEERPVARAGLVVVRPMLTLTATFDHRYADGSHAARFAAAAREYLAHPADFEPDYPVVSGAQHTP